MAATGLSRHSGQDRRTERLELAGHFSGLLILPRGEEGSRLAAGGRVQAPLAPVRAWGSSHPLAPRPRLESRLPARGPGAGPGEGLGRASACLAEH